MWGPGSFPRATARRRGRSLPGSAVTSPARPRKSCAGRPASGASSQNIVFAQAAVESWWRQDNLGDWGTEAELCPPGHGLGADGRPRECPQSYGILQTRYPYEETSWPGIGTSTAMNADAAYAIWRSCYNGYEVWLNNEPRGQQYHAGDLWGCVGRWYAGSWYTPAANRYIGAVKEYLRVRVWEQPDFNQAG